LDTQSTKLEEKTRLLDYQRKEAAKKEKALKREKNLSVDFELENNTLHKQAARLKARLRKQKQSSNPAANTENNADDGPATPIDGETPSTSLQQNLLERSRQDKINEFHSTVIAQSKKIMQLKDIQGHSEYVQKEHQCQTEELKDALQSALNPPTVPKGEKLINYNAGPDLSRPCSGL
jgi:hypothetical protein